MNETDDEVTLCCLLWAHEGMGHELSAYEDDVLALLPQHSGRVAQRAYGTGDDGAPDEIQLIHFDSAAGLDSFLADPHRLSLSARRDRAVRRTKTFPIRLR